MRYDTPTMLPPALHYWRVTRDGDPTGLLLFERHYSCYRYRDGRRRLLFVGPGEKLVLLASRGDALFVWRKFQSRNGQIGVNAAVFRNESRHRSSAMIREAMHLAWARWPNARLYTYVNPALIRSRNPGYCFLKAGWRHCGWTAGGLLILEALPLPSSSSRPPR